MMIDHFNLRQQPFTREISIEQHFQLDFIDQQIDEILRCVKMRASGLIIAPPGLGKTALIRKAISNLPETQYRVSYINVTNVSGRDLCREICTAIGAKPAGIYPAMVRAIQERMQHQMENAAIHPVIVFDDAHALRPAGFEALKCISNFEMDSKLAVSYALVGHPSLKSKLHHPDLDDVRQRIIHFGQLRNLTATETASYIEHRLFIAGGRAGLISPQAIEAIHLCAGGNMRAIDNVTLKALTAAAKNKEPIVNTQHVAAARSELWI